MTTMHPFLSRWTDLLSWVRSRVITVTRHRGVSGASLTLMPG